MKRLISIITAAVMMCTGLIGAMPANAQEVTNAKTASLDSDISVEGTNSFGNLLSSELDSEVAEQEENNGYNVFSAEVTGTEVTVSFETMSDCTLLAAIYDEAGETLIASGTAQVTEEETEKTVTIETDEMPQYFYLKVYLVDEVTMRPMCTAYESPNYTQEMQEFFALTVNDFDSERVLNFDEDETNNFAVYSYETIIIESDETVNTVATADIDNEKYVIENADSTVTSLQAGDIFVIEQTSGEVLIVKVGEIIVDGTIATITGVDTDMEEVFEIVKIDTTQTNEEATVDTSSMSEGVTYEGKTEDSMTVAEMISGGTMNLGGEYEATIGDTFNVNFTKIGEEDCNVTVSGSLSVNMTIEFECYISFKRKYIKFTIEDSIGINLSITGAIKSETKVTSFNIPVYAGIKLSVDMSLVLEASGSISTEGKLTNKSGFSSETKGGKKTYDDLSSRPKYKDTISGTATLFLGIAFKPNLNFLSKKILKLGLEANIGVEVSSSEIYYEDSTEKYPEQKHECQSCIEGKICGKLELSFNLTFLNSDKFSYKKTFVSLKKKMCDFYISSTFGDQGFKTCPHQLYRLTVKAVDSNGNPVPKAAISDGTNTYTADSEGKLIIYKNANDKCTYKASSGNLSGKKTYKMPKKAASITVKLKVPEVITQPVTTATTTTTETTITTTTDSSIIASGTCGENLTWVLDDEGTLTISGRGEMEDYFYSWDVPWCGYSDIKNVVIENGVTRLGDCSFTVCSNLTKISIPESVTSISSSAFSCVCEGSHESVNEFAFINVDAANEYYASVEGILFNKDMTILIRYTNSKMEKEYTIPDTVTSISYGAFMDCTGLTKITIPDSVISIGNNAFYNCSALTEITIPDSVTSIGNSAFFNCSALTEITIPNSVTIIYSCVFHGCNALTSITIPDSVTSIGDNAFCECTSLASITIPDSVTSIGSWAFYYCDSLTSITIPDSVTSIGWDAFDSCYVLTDVYYTGTEEQWNEITTDSGNEYLTDATIHYNSTGEVSTASLLTTAKNSAEETTLLTESFTDLLPNEVYNFYVMKSRAAEIPFSGDNLLYVTQAVSDENGELTVSYIPKETFETADIFVAGLTRTDISSATVTVPEITYTGEEILVNPEVTLNGQALTEGIDYDIEGGYLVTRPDEYTITISGTGDYTGSVDVTFTAICGHNYDGKACTICGAENPDYVEPTEPPTGEDILLGDVDSDGAVNASDASMVLAEYAIIATGGTPTFSEEQTKAADVNADSATDAIDASSILGYYAYIATGGSGTIEEYLN